MPVYNAAPYLETAIQSILNQTFGDFELVILDDGSTDGSIDVAVRFAALDSRIVLLEPESSNRGEPVVRSRLLEAARGEYIAWMDADDCCSPSRLSVQVEYLDRNKDIDAVGTAIVVADSDLRTLRTERFPSDPAALAEDPHLCTASLMLRSESAKAIGRLRDAFFPGGGDLEWVMRFCDHYKITNLDNPLYTYRKHPYSYSVYFAPIRRLLMIAFFAMRERRAGRPDPILSLDFDRNLHFLRDEYFLKAPGLTVRERTDALKMPLKGTVPLISVLVPFQDDHKHFDAAIASIAKQQFQNIEIVIFDNGSRFPLKREDPSLANVDRPLVIERTDAPIGEAEMCRRLVDIASGAFVIWHSPTNHSREDRIESQLFYMLEHPDCVAVGTGINTVETSILDAVTSTDFNEDALATGRLEGVPFTFMVKRETLLQSEVFDDPNEPVLQTGSHL
ncbi:MAG: glycosyltransferase family 2 protein, partial [Hyphomonas sp.]|nr:glycosyltransferase family 2 protein [Hyphomonas sp.]